VSDRPSVGPISPLQYRAAGLLLCTRQTGHIDQLLRGRRRSSSGPQHGVQQQMRAVARLQLT